MKQDDFNLALQILSKENSVKISLNVPITDNYSNTHKILIHKSNANTINRLIAHNFSLSMCDKGLSIDKF